MRRAGWWVGDRLLGAGVAFSSYGLAWLPARSSLATWLPASAGRLREAIQRFTTATAFRLKPEATQGEPTQGERESEQDGDVDDDVGAPIVNDRMAVEHAAAVLRRQPHKTPLE